MAKKAKSKAGVGFEDWSTPTAVERKDLPDAVKIKRKRFAMKVLVWASLGTWPILALASASTLVSGPSSAPAVSSAETFSLSKGVAAAEMRRWLSSSPAPLPGGQLVSIDEVRKQGENVTASDGSISWVEVVTFTLIDAAGNLYKAGIPVQVASGGRTSVLSAPSLEMFPAQASSEVVSARLWPSCPIGSVTEPVRNAVEQWANVYTSGDADKLRLSVGDPDGTHIYTPLPPMAQVAVASTDACQIKPQTDKPGEAVVAVRTTLEMVWQGQSMPKDGSSVQKMALDVLVEHADTAAPVITAWGAPGTGPSLVRFSNADTLSTAQAGSIPKQTVIPTVASPNPAKR